METTELPNPIPAKGTFGTAVSVGGDTLVVGAPRSHVYVFNSFATAPIPN